MSNRILRTAFHAANTALRPLGLRLDRTSLDLEDRLVDDDDLDQLCQRLASAFDQWATSQSVFDWQAEADTMEASRMFLDKYLRSPFRDKSGGSRFNNLLSLHLLAKRLRPSVIIDSGTFRGASAWALREGAPDSAVLSFDIDLSNVVQRTEGVRYIEADWTTIDDYGDLSNSLVYFDDHLDQVRRLLEARERGFRYAVFDDDFTLASFPEQANGGMALPKIEFVLDPYLESREVLRWRSRGRQMEWRVDHAYLEQGRQAIVSTERLPNTSLITGIHQTPYRAVAIRSSALE